MTSFRLVAISAVFSVLLTCVLLISSPAPVRGYDESITIEPAAPTEEDSVRVGLVGVQYYYASGCGPTGYLPYPGFSYSISGQTVVIQVTWNDVGGQCNQDSGEVWYGSWLDVGPLASGDYTVEVYGIGVQGGVDGALASFTVTPDNCPLVPNPEQADANGNGVGDACDPADSDGDDFSDRVEYSTGTSRTSGCGVNAWPVDIDNNTFVDTADIGALTNWFGAAVPPAPARVNIAPDPPDGFIDTGDIGRLTNLFGVGCT